MKSINMEGGFFCGGWNFSKSVSKGPTFIREMRVDGAKGKRKICDFIKSVNFSKSFISHIG